MIYSDVTITVKGNTATLDNDLYLYKNDKNITINISIVNSIWNFAKKLENNIIEKTEATFFTLRWMKGDKVKKVFEDQQIKKGKCEFVITEELIDEDIEMGDYDFQISLLDEEKNSILSIPPVIEQIHINKHIFEDEDINTVGNAKVGIAKVGTYEQRSTENSEGLYNKKTWQDNEVITKEDLNTIEEGIYNNSTQCKDIANVFSHEQTETLYKLKCNGKVIATIPIGSNTQITSYTVSNNLTYCTNNNPSTEVTEGDSYTATITANSGYTLSSVTISMGGVDITSTVYSNGTINITSVTGDIIINAIANIVVTPSTEPTLVWNFENATAGNGYGAITMSIGKTEDEGSYAIKYADDTGVLSNYADICTLSPTIDNPKSYTYFNKDQLIPKYATKIVALKDSTVKAEFEIPTSKRFTSGNYGRHLYSFGAISDVHIGADTAESDFATALTYLNNNENVIFTCIPGDLTNEGTVAQFTSYKNIVDTNSADTPVYATNGNHENRNNAFTDDLWNTYVNNPRDYVFTHGNEVFIFLALRGINEYVAPFTSEQQTWLEGLLEKYKNCRVFLFTHPFINGTGNGNYNNLYNVIYLKTDNTYGKWLLDLMKQYKNVFLFTGHSHLKFITQELDSRVTICNNVNNIETGYLVHIPSITIPRDIIDGSSISNYLYAQSEGVVIDVYENCILYRGRNFIDAKFIPIGQFILQKTEGTLPTVNTYTISNNLTYCSNNNTITTVNENAPYTATITANTGYLLSSVTVSMGGIDVTSTVYNNGQINITSVTGNIVITANAVVETIPCTGISLNNTTLTFTSKTPQTLVATPTPSNTTDSITWESNHIEIATVSNGVVTPVSAGTCVITVKCGNQTATCNVTISLPNQVSITWQEGTKLDSSTGKEMTGQSSYSASDYIELLDGKTYTVHCTLPGTDGQGDVSCKFALYDSNKTFLGYAKQTLAKANCPCDIVLNELNSNAKYFRFRAYHSGNAKEGFLNSLSVTYA